MSICITTQGQGFKEELRETKERIDRDETRWKN